MLAVAAASPGTLEAHGDANKRTRAPPPRVRTDALIASAAKHILAAQAPGWRHREAAKATNTPMSAAASPYQVRAYSRWRFGSSRRVAPPRGQPPGLRGSSS